LPFTDGDEIGWVVKRSPFLSMLAAGLLGGCVTAAALLGAGVGRDGTRTVISASALGGVPSPEAASDGALTAREIYQRDAPGVVYIRARSLQGGSSPFDLEPRQADIATGSGFVIDDKGRVLTNAHVVAGATDIRVTFSGSRTVSARVLGKDEDSDLALLAVDPDGLDLKPLELGSSTAVQVGDPTVAIGNPFGLDRTLTTGVVSAKQRRITAPSGFSIENVIQTDAAINPGNSGGPLLDAGGRVIGINSQIATAAGSSGNIGIAFAVPIDTAKSVMPDLVAHHMVSHAYLGIRAGYDSSAVTFDSTGKPGVRVEEVDPGGPAARAGILGDGTVAGGDVILSVDGVPVHSMAEIDDVIARHRPGDGIPVILERNGGRVTVQLQLAERPASIPIG
jgi:S1-C subfamily serine protease